MMKLFAIMASVLLWAGAVQAESTVVVKNGASDYRIVTPDDKSQPVAYAAQKLQKFFQEITGVQLPIVSESLMGEHPGFLLGPCKRSVAAGLLEEAAKLREDGVLIKTLDRDIALLGQNERGHLYSVYVLLEKYLGVRFLAWDCTVVPKRVELTLPELNYAYSPPFMYRETLYFDSFPKEIATRQRLNGPYTKCDASVGGNINFFPYVHSFDDLFPDKEYFKDHPEYYGLQNGKRVAGSINAQLCLTHPDVLRLAKAKVLKWIDEHPEIPIFDVSQNDGGGPCECEACMAIVKEEGSQQGPILRFVNAIADEVAKTHPDKWIETLAYAYAVKPPAVTKPRANVIIRLCHVGCYFHGFEKCGMGSEFRTWLEQWSKLTQNIIIWHYGTNFGHYLAPNPNLAGLVKDIKYYGGHGVRGLMVQGNYQGPGGELAELRQYLCAQLMWDVSRDPGEIREEFCRGYYGKASVDVMKFLGQMDKLAERPVHGFANWDPKDITPPEFVTEALSTLQHAWSSAETPAIRNRVEKLMLPCWYVQLLHPEKYGLSQEDGAALLARVKQLFAMNKITYVTEGMEASAWLASMDKKYPSQPKNAKAKSAEEWKQKQFIITFWLPPPAKDEVLARVAAEHYNWTWASVEGLDVVARHGLRAMLQSDLLDPAVLDDPAKRAQLDALIERAKKHPALEAYFITDEPGAGAFAGLGKLVAYLKERDPAHLAFINLFPTYANETQLGVTADAAERAKVGYPENFAGVGTNDKTVLAYREHLRKFIETLKPDLISYDHYHFMKDGSDGQQYFLNLGLIRMAALEAKKPFLNTIQGCDCVKVWRLPNASELRWLINTTMAYGGRGISYFIYWGDKTYGGLYQEGKPTPLAADVAAINDEMAHMGPALLELDSMGVYHTAPLPYGTQAVPANCPVQIIDKGEYVLGLFGTAGRTTSFMIVNRSYKTPAEAVLKIAIPGRKLEELDRKTGKWSPRETLGADRTIKMKLVPADGRLLRVVE